MFLIYDNKTSEPLGPESTQAYDIQFSAQKAGLAVGVVLSFCSLMVLGYLVVYWIHKRYKGPPSPRYLPEPDSPNALPRYRGPSPCPHIHPQFRTESPPSPPMPYPYSSHPDLASGHRQSSWSQADQEMAQARLFPAHFLESDSAPAAGIITQPDPAKEPSRGRDPVAVRRGLDAAPPISGVGMPAREHGAIRE